MLMDIPEIWRQYFAEFIATFALVFIGAGAVIASVRYANVSLVGVALAHGLVLMAMIYATAHISGAHVNPVVTFTFWLTKRIDAMRAAGYIISQLLGAIAAGFALKLIYGTTIAHLGATQLAPGISPAMGIFIEGLLTFFLVFTIFGAAVDSRASSHHAGLAIGLVLAFNILMGGNLTGAAMNPARSFGPAFAAGMWNNHIVYWIGPLIGAACAGLLYQYLFLKKSKRT